MSDPSDKKDAAEGRRYIFGPVPSRRLGLSLGLDLVPPKTCTLDCLYCEVGKTTCRTLERFNRHMADDLLGELDDVLTDWDTKLDCVTLAGSGEPALNSEISYIIEQARKLTSKPLVVLTNGTLLDREDVRQDLAGADLVIPSLDAADPETFRRVNLPHPDLDLARIIEGLFRFRDEFSGRMWLEVLLVEGVNDHPDHLQALGKIIRRLKPERVQVNTVFRPPAYPGARAVSAEKLEEAARILGPGAAGVSEYSGKRTAATSREIKSEILAALQRRPQTCRDICDVLGLEDGAVGPVLKELENSRQIQRERHGGQDFYRKVPGGDNQ